MGGEVTSNVVNVEDESNGPRMEPCGTPEVTLIQWEAAPSQRTCCLRCESRQSMLTGSHGCQCDVASDVIADAVPCRRLWRSLGMLHEKI